MQVIKSHKCFDGNVVYCEHYSQATGTDMKLSYFLPDKKPKGAIIWLSGLTCTEENFITKAGAFESLCENDMMVVCPDTSPRGLDLKNEHESFDFGSGAGFYLTALTEGYKDSYRMDSYIMDEIHPWISSTFELTDRISISGHSMGGHGSLTIGLKNASSFTSISAFAPIVNPMLCPWGTKAFTGYLGSDPALWAEYDACSLVKTGHKHPKPILVDQGLADPFLKEQLKTENFEKACSSAGQKLHVKYRKDFDHSFFYISTFIAEHVQYHAKSLDA
ncbi:S-formylglutathione hydrolase [Oligoflexaceae bacterium]|nr:S-formylglutathione hydrolase [Oligoflexaceae bacterium]